MSCIALYRGDFCHFHLLSIENIADFVMCSSIRAVRAHLWQGGGEGGGGGGEGLGVDKFIQNQADGGGGGVLSWQT